MLGHELRNPLAAIRNATTLLDYIEHPQLGKIRAVLDRQSTQMIKLVDGLLDVSRIARGKIDLKIETLDLRDLLDGVIRDRRDEADRLELRIASRYPPRPVWIAGDRARLTQIFDNVVGNAVKFSNRGATIDIGLDESGDEAAVRVHDTGVGITPELLEAIFEPFRQDPHDPARAASGIGLGLALVKRLVELHGGSVVAESGGRGLGATFTVRLPRAPAPRAAERRGAHRAAPATAQRRVLLVEDNADAAAILQAVLELRGHYVRTAPDVPTGLALLREEGADVVLCDIGLPGASGYDFARAVRADAAFASTLLVALTGYGQPSDRRRTAEAGFDEHLTKPVDPDALDRTFDRLAQK
jgi:CheY-like chemotaxis protein